MPSPLSPYNDDTAPAGVMTRPARRDLAIVIRTPSTVAAFPRKVSEHVPCDLKMF
jgi:hypothetical protein